MLVCRDESIEFTPEDRQNMGPAVGAWVSEMEERGVRLQGDVLAPVNATATVSVRGGETRVDRGPRVRRRRPRLASISLTARTWTKLSKCRLSTRSRASGLSSYDQSPRADASRRLPPGTRTRVPFGSRSNSRPRQLSRPIAVPFRTEHLLGVVVNWPSVGLTDDFCAPCWSVRQIPTYGRLTPCGN